MNKLTHSRRRIDVAVVPLVPVMAEEEDVLQERRFSFTVTVPVKVWKDVTSGNPGPFVLIFVSEGVIACTLSELLFLDKSFDMGAESCWPKKGSLRLSISESSTALGNWIRSGSVLPFGPDFSTKLLASLNQALQGKMFGVTTWREASQLMYPAFGTEEEGEG